MIVAGMAFDKEHLGMLEETFKLLDHALVLLKRYHFEAWLLFKRPYTGDPGDPAIVDEWRKKRPGLIEWHDCGVEKLAGYLEGKDVYVPWPSRMQTRKPSSVKEMIDEFYALYRKFRDEKTSKTKAVNTAAEMCEYSQSRAWEIVGLREGKTG